MCVTRNSCTPTCTHRVQCRRTSCLGLGITYNSILKKKKKKKKTHLNAYSERVFSDYSMIGSLTADGTKLRDGAKWYSRIVLIKDLLYKSLY